MFHDTPRRPTGTDPFYKFQGDTHDFKQRRLIAGNGVRISRTARGDKIESTAKGGKGSGAISVTFRGEYFSGAVYAVGDEVWVLSGANRGSYICIKDNPGAANAPWVGNGYWAKRPGDSALGQWM